MYVIIDAMHLVWQASPFTREEGSGVMPIRKLYCCSQECSPIRLTNQVPDLLVQ